MHSNLKDKEHSNMKINKLSYGKKGTNLCHIEQSTKGFLHNIVPSIICVSQTRPALRHKMMLGTTQIWIYIFREQEQLA